MKKNKKDVRNASGIPLQNLPPLIQSEECKTPRRFKKHSPREYKGLSRSGEILMPSMNRNENTRMSADAGLQKNITKFVSKGLFKHSKESGNLRDQLPPVHSFGLEDDTSTASGTSSEEEKVPESDLPILLLEANAGNMTEALLHELSLSYDLVMTPVTLQELSAISCKSAESEYDALGKDIVGAFKLSESKSLTTEQRISVQNEIKRQLTVLDPKHDRVLISTIKKTLDRYVKDVRAPEVRLESRISPRAAQIQSSMFYAEKISERLPLIKYARLVKKFKGLNWQMPISLEDEKLTLKQMCAYYPIPGNGLAAYINDRLMRIHALKVKGIVPTDSPDVQAAQNQILQGMFDLLRSTSLSNINTQLSVYRAKYNQARDKSAYYQDTLEGYSEINASLGAERYQQMINERKKIAQKKSEWDKKKRVYELKVDVCTTLLSSLPVTVCVSDSARGQVMVGNMRCSSKYDFNDLYQCMATKLLGGSLLSSNTGIQSQINENLYLSVLLNDFQLVNRHDLQLGRINPSM